MAMAYMECLGVSAWILRSPHQHRHTHTDTHIMRVTVLALGPSDVSAETRRCQTTPRRFWGFQLAEMVWPDGSPVERIEADQSQTQSGITCKTCLGVCFPTNRWNKVG